MKCVDSTEVMRLCAGQLPLERAQLLQVHFEHCARCAALRDDFASLTGRIRPEPAEFEDSAAVEEVMALIRMGKADRPLFVPSRLSFWRSWQTWLALPATAIATALLMLFVRPQQAAPASDGFQARGGELRAAHSLDRFVSLQPFRATGSGYEPVHGTLWADDALAFTYLNGPANPLRYLAILAVDESGKVYWYYPPRDQGGTSAGSIAIQSASEPVELPEQVVHALRPGPLRVFGIFSAQPLSRETIALQVQHDLHAAGGSLTRMGRLSLADVGQHSLLLQVQPARARGETP